MSCTDSPNYTFPVFYINPPSFTTSPRLPLSLQAKKVTPVLGISFHDGALVTNYPWDGQPELYTGQYAKSPDDALFVELGRCHVTGYQPIRDQYLLARSVPEL